MSLKCLIAAGSLALAGAQLAGVPRAAAQTVYGAEVPVPVRPQGYVFTAPDAPTVLRATPPGPVAPAFRTDLTGPAVPVAQVMNGGGFGLTGTSYYNDQYSEGALGQRRHPKQYEIVPGYIVAPRP